jgi:hypothetical protein
LYAEVYRRQYVSGAQAAVTVSWHNPFGELKRILDTYPTGGPLVFDPVIVWFSYDKSGQLVTAEGSTDHDMALG